MKGVVTLRSTAALACLLITMLAGPATIAGSAPALRADAAPYQVTAEAVPAGGVGVTSFSVYEVGDELAVVGEVWNRSGLRRLGVEVTVTLLGGGVPVGEPITDLIVIAALADGEVSPFVIYTQQAGTTVDATVTYEGTPSNDPPAGILEVREDAVVSDPGGQTRTHEGTLRNVGGPSADVIVALTTYDTNGLVIDTNWSAIANVAGFGEVPFSLVLVDDPGRPVAATRYTADGWRNGSVAYVTTWTNYFDDVGATSFRDDIIWLAEAGITTGCGPGRYCTEDPVSRAQMASFLARALGLTGSPADHFTDDEGSSHELNINRIAEAGITTGCGLNLYCPAVEVPRDQMASFLARALGLTGNPPDRFTDDEGSSHELNINRIAAGGLTNGCAATLYCPSDLVTRGQMAAFLHRAFD